MKQCWICIPEGGCLTPDECYKDERDKVLGELTQLSHELGMYDDEEE